MEKVLWRFTALEPIPSKALSCSAGAYIQQGCAGSYPYYQRVLLQPRPMFHSNVQHEAYLETPAQREFSLLPEVLVRASYVRV